MTRADVVRSFGRWGLAGVLAGFGLFEVGTILLVIGLLDPAEVPVWVWAMWAVRSIGFGLASWAVATRRPGGAWLGALLLLSVLAFRLPPWGGLHLDDRHRRLTAAFGLVCVVAVAVSRREDHSA